MSTDLLTPKIELLQEQIDNLERSGFFTEAEMDRASSSLRMELKFLEASLVHSTFAENLNKVATSINKLGKHLYGMTPEDYIEGMKVHNECFDQLKSFKVFDYHVKDAEVLIVPLDKL